MKLLGSSSLLVILAAGHQQASSAFSCSGRFTACRRLHFFGVNTLQSPRFGPQCSTSTSTLFAEQEPSFDFGGSDFGSAMPEKPEQTIEEKMMESAESFVEVMTQTLGEGVEAPSELEDLRKAVQGKAGMKELAEKVYILMIERGMRYDEAPETGTLTPTDFDIPANLDVKEVRDEFAYLYKYGMMLMDKDLLTADQVKEIVLERLIKRTGLTPEKFDEWLGY